MKPDLDLPTELLILTLRTNASVCAVCATWAGNCKDKKSVTIFKNTLIKADKEYRSTVDAILIKYNQKPLNDEVDKS